MIKTNFKDSDLSYKISDLSLMKNQKALVLWAAACAEHVLHIYGEYPMDNWPRKAIEASRSWVKCDLSTGAVRKIAFGVHAAARAAEMEAVCMAVRSAGHAAATAHTKGHAVHSATYAVKAVFYDSNKDESDSKVNKERKWQYDLLVSMD